MKLVNLLLTDDKALNLMWEKGNAFTANQRFLLAKSKQLAPLERWFIETLFRAERVVVEDMSPMKNTMQQAVQMITDSVFAGKETPEAAAENAQAFAMGNWRSIYEAK